MPKKPTKKQIAEEQKIIDSKVKINTFVSSSEWQIVRQSLIDKIMDLQSVMNIDNDSSPEIIVIDMRSRKIAIEILLEWLRDIEGTALEVSSTPKMLKDIDFIRNYDSED